MPCLRVGVFLFAGRYNYSSATLPLVTSMFKLPYPVKSQLAKLGCSRTEAT